MLAFDTETRNVRWWENPAFLGSYDTGAGGEVVSLPPHGGDSAAVGGPRLKALLEAHDHVVGANTKFDAHMVRESLGVEIFRPGAKVDDVLLMSRLVFGSRRAFHGLKELATDLIDPLAAEAEREMQARYKELTGRMNMEHDDAFFVTWKALPGVVEKYAAKDAEFTRALYEKLRPLIRSDAKLDRLYREVERPLQEVLYRAEQHGVHVDPEAVERLTKYYRQRDAEARAKLKETLGFVPEGEGSEELLREALPRVGVNLTERTPSGELAVNRRALSKFSDHPAVAALFEFRRVNKFLDTYILPLEGKDHIHPTFNQAQAWTGRMSGSNPNMQNLPKRTETTVEENLRVRSVFVPSPGYEFLIADFDSIEMRMLAYYLGNPNYRREVDQGDPHSFTAANAAQVLGLASSAPEDYRKNTPNRWFRDAAKQVTYSIVYGGGGPVVMDTMNKMVVDAGHPEYVINLEQAREIRRRIIQAIPGFQEFIKAPYDLHKAKPWQKGKLFQQLEKSAVLADGTPLQPHEIVPALDAGENVWGYVRTVLGRKQWIPFDKSYVALSGLIQGSAADAMKAAAIAVYEALKPYGGRVILFVHDEIVAEVPKGWGERLLPVMVEAMESAVHSDPPLRVEAHITSKSYAHSD